MLRVNTLVRDEIFSHRSFLLRGRNIDKRKEFPLEEKHRDLLRLILSLHHVECQEPRKLKLVLDTHFADEFNSIKYDLERLFLVLTGRPIELVMQLRTARGSQAVLDDLEPRDPILFSGGVDSISGAIRTISKNPKSILLHVDSSRSIFGKVRRILADRFFNTTNAYCIDTRIQSRATRSLLSNTRGLLFLTAGYVVSKALNSSKLVFCENGAQMLDAMMERLAYNNAIATKNTNPRYLQEIENLLRKFEGSQFVVKYPLISRTKSESISEYLNKDLLKKSWSCYSARGRRKMCGHCWNCFITRLSALAAGFGSESLVFKTNPLKEMLASSIYLDNQRIIYNMIVFYRKVIDEDSRVLNELRRYESIFRNPLDLATRFALDLFLGLSTFLSNVRNKNGLGRKADELLSGIDPSLLLDRKEILSSHQK